MPHQVHTAARHVLALLIVLLVCHAIPAASLEGRWKLVEQNYGKGQANLVADDPRPVELEFSRRGAVLDAAIRAGDVDLPWPSLVAEESRRVYVDEKVFSGMEDRVRVRYRVEPSPGDDLVLHVTEDYRVVEEGRALVGSVKITFQRQGKERGSYTLHRRFEKQP